MRGPRTAGLEDEDAATARAKTSIMESSESSSDDDSDAKVAAVASATGAKPCHSTGQGMVAAGSPAAVVEQESGTKAEPNPDVRRSQKSDKLKLLGSEVRVWGANTWGEAKEAYQCCARQAPMWSGGSACNSNKQYFVSDG